MLRDRDTLFVIMNAVPTEVKKMELNFNKRFCSVNMLKFENPVNLFLVRRSN